MQFRGHARVVTVDGTELYGRVDVELADDFAAAPSYVHDQLTYGNVWIEGSMLPLLVDHEHVVLLFDDYAPLRVRVNSHDRGDRRAMVVECR